MYALSVGLQGAQPIFASAGISDPLKASLTIASLVEAGAEVGYSFSLSNDFLEFARLRETLRGGPASPMFDLSASRTLNDNGFWMQSRNMNGEVTALQAFRLDEADPTLADWVLGWMMGHYARRREMIVPRHLQPPEHSLTRMIRGRVAYHGELWVEKHSKGCFNIFPRLGMLLAMIKWQPEAIWALTGESMATRGHMVRMGYGHLEPSFLTWEWVPGGAEDSEWIGIAERRHLEFQISEMDSRAAVYQPSQIR